MTEPTQDAGMLARLRELLPIATGDYGKPGSEQFDRMVEARMEFIAALPRLLDLASERGREWQPIETAPKDGIPIRIKGDGGPYDISHWKGVAKWGLPTNWNRRDATWLSTTDGAVLSVAGYHPTHWMPLTDSPREAADIRTLSPPSGDDGESVSAPGGQEKSFKSALSDRAPVVTTGVTKDRKPKARQCDRCDFGTGQRGMDRCPRCDGTGSVFFVAEHYYANTEKGYEAALEARVDELAAALSASASAVAEMLKEADDYEKEFGTPPIDREVIPISWGTVRRVCTSLRAEGRQK